MYFNKYLRSFFVVVVLISSLFSGCAQLKEKFIPKKEEAKETKRYKSVSTYDVKPSLELYTKRYVFWKNWQK